MRINNNIPSLVTYNSLTATLAETQKVIRRLSTGLRINSAADDAAGLAISEKMRAQIRGIDKAVANSQDGISMIQTAEGAMNESHSILQRMRELSVQAANDALTMNDREYIQLEIDQLKEELDRIANTTQFNKKKLLDGTADALWSTDLEGTEVFVNGTTVTKDQFGQTSAMEGNFIIETDVVRMGRNQVLKSNIFTYMSSGGDAMAAGVNSNLSDIANFYDANGVNMLADPQSLTVSFGDGSNATIQIYANDTLGTLGEKLSAAIVEASGIPMGESAAAQYVSDGKIPPNVDDPILNGLASNWLWGAAKRLSEQYGLTISGNPTLTIRILEDEVGGWGGRAGIDANGPWIEIDSADFMPATPPDGKSAGGGFSDDRTMAHELTHVLTFADPEISAAIKGTNGLWLIEGLAEYIHGANLRVQQDVVGSYDITAVRTQIGTLLTSDYSSYDSTYGSGDFKYYTAAYLAVRYFDEKSISNGGDGIKGLLQELHNGTSLDAAITAASNSLFSSTTVLQSSINTGNDFENFLTGVLQEDYNYDTGAIGGFYASGGNPLSPSAVIEGNETYRLNPIAEWGWAGINWPDAMPGASDTQPSPLSVVAPQNDTLQAVNGTLLLHSSLLGSVGEMTISGDENLIKALGFAEIQSARDTVYEVRITDAHSGDLLTSGVRISGGEMYGVLHENIDIRLINNFAIGVDASNLRTDGYGSYVFEESGRNSFVVHIAANSSVLQIGANQGEDMVISFGNVGSAALGVDKVSVRDRELAARATTIIDNAISRVSTKRARLGAYQNRLEHTITNLTAASTNTAAAESRIRDADMAKEMISLTRLNILSQAGNSMLGQANQLPQNVLMLLR